MEEDTKRTGSFSAIIEGFEVVRKEMERIGTLDFEHFVGF